MVYLIFLVDKSVFVCLFCFVLFKVGRVGGYILVRGILVGGCEDSYVGIGRIF